ncbi:type I-F CRISPR-associated endoribonuclease Cas6/Csy4 [Endozoicomonas sp. SM1973]|uniref:Type I-F CRISPR-associated endoribonuclease Cas6/Csy4 n=1 Tax=Spartinivicinus marinus TaxID=2994442 RepID=A0A853ICR2_9GAMM|nr:type I-F CRISPR-associated endoribonuclease Cas6/Csy4 [Spartinivicinus marinus]MCX4030211.1 type I-F CRISPR-associated endoribonuclease Cas6/Csy4 [Spartinivicinus marinus]NYZ67854.1 type I-F CRISPR-associated endoribonuclease Cas6/Csy4 [Spartinivicinus marinus]
MQLSHYVDVDIITPANETGWMMGKVMRQLHGYLSANEINTIGVAFPELKNNHPGNQLRIFGDQTALARLIKGSNLLFLQESGGIKLIQCLNTPEVNTFVSYRRSQRADRGSPKGLKKGQERFIQYLKNKGIEPDQTILKARAHRWHKEYQAERAFLSIGSKSTGQQFQLCIQQTLSSKPTEGYFSSYGLSKSGTTLPYF